MDISWTLDTTSNGQPMTECKNRDIPIDKRGETRTLIWLIRCANKTPHFVEFSLHLARSTSAPHFAPATIAMKTRSIIIGILINKRMKRTKEQIFEHTNSGTIEKEFLELWILVRNKKKRKKNFEQNTIIINRQWIYWFSRGSIDKCQKQNKNETKKTKSKKRTLHCYVRAMRPNGWRFYLPFVFRIVEQRKQKEREQQTILTKHRTIHTLTNFRVETLLYLS